MLVGPVSALCGMTGCILSGISSDWLVKNDRVGGRFLLPLVWWPFALAGLTLLVSAPTPSLALCGVGLFMIGSGFGLASVVPTIQDITPSQFRGQATSLHFVLAGLLAFGSAPTMVALVNDHLFGDPAALGRSCWRRRSRRASLPACCRARPTTQGGGTFSNQANRFPRE